MNRSHRDFHPVGHGAVRRLLGAVAAVCAVVGTSLSAQAQVTLADSPPLSTYAVPGNLALALSVEFPTAISVAHTNRVYSAASEYLGYFDPNKCYVYNYDSTDTPANQNATPATWFAPGGLASSHLCSGKWSGNFLNWAAMQTIDTFRWVLTGGYRVRDDANLTVIEKAWGSNQGNQSNFPDSTLAAADIAGATPFNVQGVSVFSARILGQGNWMRFTVGQRVAYSVQYWNNTTRSGQPVLSRTEYGTASIQSNASPGPGVNATQYSAQFTGQVAAPATGSYQFRFSAVDGSRLYINGAQVAYADLFTTSTSAVMTFNAGDVINIQINYMNTGATARLAATWTTPLSSTFTEIGPTGSLNASSQAYTGGAVSANSTYDIFVRAKVCDPSYLETNCNAYGANYKPEGLLQKYNRQLRYSAFGYLNDQSGTEQRDGGVLRARQTFVGPTQPAYGSPDITNTAAEWNATTGVFLRNPDATDANNSAVVQSDSGVLNYVNKFGEITHKGYKVNDPVSELYYASLRYFRNLGNVPEWSDVSTQTGANQVLLLDGFPAIRTWDDPIIYSCQRNFVLGIGDVHTHADKNVPGNTNTYKEPTMPSAVKNDVKTPNAVTATTQVGQMEGFTATSSPSLASMLGNQWTSCCDGNATLMAGLAYDAHTSDIRPDLTSKTKIMTVDTYWVDVQEGQKYELYNQFYLATKYGGFTVPTGFQPYASTTPLTDASWWSGSDYNYTSDATPVQQKRPNNYYSGGRPDLMQSGLTSAFAAIASAAGQIASSSFLTSLPQIGSAGTPSYSAGYDASTWSGTLLGSFTTLSASGSPSSTNGGEFGKILTAQGPINRSIATWSVSTSNTVASRGVQFEATTGTGAGASSLNATQLSALDTSYVSNNDSADYLAYLRGDRSKERLATATVADATRPYRTRASLLGDIVDSKPTVVGVASFPFSDSSNPGYSAFKSGVAGSRPTVVYVGANDGMLHAVKGDLATSSAAGAGSELFAYVPNALFQGPNNTPNVDGLASLGNPTFSHHYMVDATASNFDVDFNRTSDGSSAPPAVWAPDWHTILIGGLGKGGKAFYAIDVTDPASMTNEITLASKVLWEFTQAQTLGYTYGEPAVVKTRKYGWTVVLPSGYNNTDGVGHLMFLNPKTGKLLETVNMPTGSAGLAHVNAYLVDGTDGTADALYAGDLQGNVWRVDVTGAFGAAFPAPLQLAQLTSGGSSPAAQPITTRPQIAVDPTSGRRFVLVGTGRLLDSSDIGPNLPAGQTQSFYAIIDGTNAAFNATAPSGVTWPVTRSQLTDDTQTLTANGTNPAALTAAGWFIDLLNPSTGPASRLLIDSTTSSGNVGFATTEPNGNACSPGGSSAIYAVHFGTAQSILIDNSNSVLSYATTTTPATETKFVSNNGNLTFLYGANGTPNQAAIKPNGGNPPRRLNWREVPIAD